MELCYENTLFIARDIAPAVVVSNAPSATNGLASNPSRKSKTNSVLNSASPKPAPEDKSESAKPATANTPNVPVPQGTLGTIHLKNVKTPPLTALSVRCIMPMGHVQMTIFPVRNCLVL